MKGNDWALWLYKEEKMKKRIILCMVFLLGMVLVPRDKVFAYGTEVTEAAAFVSVAVLSFSFNS